MKFRILLVTIGLTLATAYAADAQVVVTQGPVSTANKFAWELPPNMDLSAAPTFEFRLRDTQTPGVVRVISGFTCVNSTVNGGLAVTCTAPFTDQIVTDLNKVSNHELTLTSFRSDVGESTASLPFSLRSPAGAVTGGRIIK